MSVPKKTSGPLAEEKKVKKTRNFGLVKYVVFIAFISFLSFLAGFKSANGSLAVPKNIGVLSSGSVANKTSDKADFARFWEVWDRISQTYYDKSKIDANKMLEGAISGMVRSLGDPYTSYLPKEENTAVNEDLEGSFEGVGMELGYNEAQQLIVVSPIEKSPALRAGIKSKDRIVAINGEDSTGITLPEAVKKIRGKAGTSVKLKILSNGDVKTRDVELMREVINIPSLTLTYQGDFAVIKINKFGEKTNTEWDRSVSELLAKNSKGLILDLRNNPGGFLSSAVYLGSEFVNGTVVIQEGVNNVRKEFKAERQGRLLSMPVVVLVNEGSASASEILSGAIKISAKGSLVGKKTFGKGTIQEVEDFEDGSGLHVTVAKWLLPSGEWINGVGINPDYEVDLTEEDVKNEKDPQMDKALEIIRSKR